MSEPSSPQDVAAASNRLGVRLLQDASAKSPNVMISPASIYAAMSLASFGTKGQSEAEAMEALGLTGTDRRRAIQLVADVLKGIESGDPKAQSRIANSMWLGDKHKFHSSYISEVGEPFGAKIARLDFSSAGSVQQINNWVAGETNNKITKLVDRLDPETLAVLANAIWFKGKWQEKFDKSESEMLPFHVNPSKELKTSFMHRKDSMVYGESENASWVSIPYGSGRFSMYVALPKKGITPRQVLVDSKGMAPSMSRREVDLFLPKWKSRFRWSNAADALSQAGFGSLFQERKADFGRMTPQAAVISRVIHQSFIEVDEEGTEAAAATGVVIMPTSVQIPKPPVVMKVDRPFLYMIRDNRIGLTTFMGIMSNPTLASQ